VSPRYPWLFVANGFLLVCGVFLMLIGDVGWGVAFALFGVLGFWEAWIVSGGGRRRPSPRFVAVAKHVPLLILLLVGSIWIVATGIGYVTSGQSGDGWWRIAFAALLLVAFLFALRRALRDLDCP
jgi:MYXO-CTERM domain-containing protein